MNQHEVNYRGANIAEKMKAHKLFVCGAGALGSNLIDILSRQGFESISVIDMDRVEKHNTSTQIYSLKDVGLMKVNQLKAIVYNNTKSVLSVFGKELDNTNAQRMFQGHDLIIDVFDNWKSRAIVKVICEKYELPCVHAGMSDSGFSEIKWNNNYIIPKVETEQKDICDYPLAANLVHLTVSLLSEIIVQYVSFGKQFNREITLKDISVHKV